MISTEPWFTNGTGVQISYSPSDKSPMESLPYSVLKITWCLFLKAAVMETVLGLPWASHKSHKHSSGPLNRPNTQSSVIEKGIS